MNRQRDTHPRPPWLTVRAPSGDAYQELRSLVERLDLHTVCHSANCPNVGECWARRTATFMILGDVCTRNCRFCAVASGKPAPPDPEEPRRVAQAVAALGLRHAVITSVTRDDLVDGGASAFAAVIRVIREVVPGCGVEVLVPDFCGDDRSLRMVLAELPDVLNHNVETVPRLYSAARPQADYRRSLNLLGAAKRLKSGIATKSGMMIGLGEKWEEIVQVMAHLRGVGCDALTIGQYLSPTPQHLPVVRFYTPDEFDLLRQTALDMGFAHVESGPLVRSSYHAGPLR